MSATPGALADVELSRVLAGAPVVGSHVRAVAHRLSLRPIETWRREDPPIEALGWYLFECTARDDRVFVTFFAPDLYFYAERPFAGGQVYLQPGWHGSEADQRLTIERLETQHVPVVIERADADYRTSFPLVHAWVQEHYRPAPALAPANMRAYRLLVDRRVTPTGIYEPLGAPCFR